MRHNGHPLTTPQLTSSLTLSRQDGTTLTLELQPLPLGFYRRLRERGVIPPTPPSKPARDSNGRLIRDAQGHAVTINSPHDPQYLADLERYHQRVAVLSLAEALTADPHTQFESQPPTEAAGNADISRWLTYADQLADELESAGFRAGDLIIICQEICRLSNLLGDQLNGATANFSSGSQTDST
ncbi:MAG: hypothetical protein KDA90_05365 [Planctomycetaceae bacterium]|nr:hypothetical protein [Planctomycetaceae bacterium]